MQLVLRMVLVDPCTGTREELKRILAGMDPVWVEAECAHYDELPDVLNQTSPDIVVIDIDSDMTRGLEMISHTLRVFPNARVFVTSGFTDSQRILQAMRSGAHEYLTTPVQMDDLLPALDRVRLNPTRPGGGNASSTSKVIAVSGVVGGVGATAVAVNVGCAMASDPSRRVVLVDLDMVMGDADVCLDLVHTYTLIDVVENINRLDFTLLKRSLVQHKSGLWFLPHPSSLAEVARVQPESLKRLIGLLKATFSHVILNLSNGFRDTDIAAMEVSDTILFVAQLDVSCVRNLSRLFKTLEGSEGLAERVKIILNRVGARELTIPVEKAEQTIGHKVFWQIPNDWQNVSAARSAGVPLLVHAPRAKASVALSKLAEELVGSAAPSEPAATSKRRGLFAMFSGND